MLIVYASRTGNVKRFISKLDTDHQKVFVGDCDIVNKPFILVTYTTGFGNVPKEVEEFLEKNHKFLKGVSASGNKNWGNNFAKSADIISELYSVPIVLKFELSGTKGEINLFKERVDRIESY